MNIDLKELSGDKKNFYEYLWKDNSFSAEPILTGKTDHSYEFFNVINDVSIKMAELFDLQNKSEFYKKFKMSCSGNGDEIKKITTMHSSSLCALLFFYNVTKDNTLTINYPGLENVVFYESLFEVKNKVIRFPSNVDVVLIGYNINNEEEKVLLFLESKFSEYITGITKKGKSYEIGKGYIDSCDTKKIYCSEVLEDFGLKLDTSHHDKYYLIPDTDKYVEGIKQMVSHHVGIRNFLQSGPYNKNDEEVIQKLKALLNDKDKLKVILGEIVFDNFPEKQLQKLDEYEKDYLKISDLLNSIYNDCGVKVLDKTLRYSLFKNNGFKLDKKVAQFYRV